MGDAGNIAKYLRISKDDGRFGESQSIENQRKLVNDYINSHPDLKGRNALEFVDDGHTGTNFQRPGVTQMLDMARKGGISCIIVKDFSRFGREYIDVGDYLEQIFPFLGIRFISVTDCYDSAVHGGLAGDIGNGFKNLYNSYYSKDLSRKVRAGLLARKESGAYIPSFCPFGYIKNETLQDAEPGANLKYSVAVDEDEAAVIRRIFDLKLAGNNAPQIAMILNKDYIPAPLSRKMARGEKKKGIAKSDNPLWTREKVTSILNDIRYTGVFAYNMYQTVGLGQKKARKIPRSEWKLIPGALPAIIDSDVFKQTRSKPQSQGRIGRGGIGKKPLAGKLFCGGCGYALKREIQRKSERCRCSRKELTGNTECLEGYMEMADIENVLLAAIQKLFEIYHSTETAKCKSGQKSAGISHVQALRVIQAKINLITEKKTMLYDQYCDGKFTKDEYIINRNNEDESLRPLEQELAALEQEPDTTDKPNTSAAKMADKLNGLIFEGTLTRELTLALIEQVFVYNGSIEIKWTFEDPIVKV